jgi:hypothetical protein
VKEDEERGAGVVVRKPERVRPRARYALSAFLYTRALALVAACAFASLWTQVDGLYSDRGLTPVSGLFAMLGERADVGFFDLPTLVWLQSTSGMLDWLCAVGMTACLLLFVGIVPRIALIVAWASYLSLLNAGIPWTSFQWDLLLVEVLLASALFVPAMRLDRFDGRVEPNVAGRWLIWLVLFRLMLRSGIAKLASGDPTWADLSALEFHYFTQPLPTIFGWYAAHLPWWLDRICCALMFVVELVLPFFVLLPFRWARRTAAAGFAGLMMAIAMTGNYGFFNLLTLVLVMSLVDDDAWRSVLPTRVVAWIDRGGSLSATGPTVAAVAAGEVPHASAAGGPLGARMRSGVAILLAVLGMLGFSAGLLGFGFDPIDRLRPFRSLNDYGLFAVMTTKRPEVEIEGSLDGSSWTPYVFRYKIGPVDRAPVWSTPHQPRLDWQMWFAALGSVRQNPWLERLMSLLAENDPVVLDLLAGNPFPEEPPHFVRAVLYDYRPTRLAEQAETGAWWTRERLGLYAPIFVRPGAIAPGETD